MKPPVQGNGDRLSKFPRHHNRKSGLHALERGGAFLQFCKARDPARDAAAPAHERHPPGPDGLEREFGERLAEADLTVEQGIVWGDEMRLGLISRGCRVWAPRGVVVSQEVPINQQYIYVAMALDPMTGQL